LRAGSRDHSGCGARPDQATSLLIPGLGMRKEDGACEIGQVVIRKGKLAFQGTIGDSTVLVQHGDRVAEDLIERHSGSSACRVTLRSMSPACLSYQNASRGSIDHRKARDGKACTLSSRAIVRSASCTKRK